MRGKQRCVKLADFLGGFLILHFAYDFFPILPFKILSGVDVVLPARQEMWL